MSSVMKTAAVRRSRRDQAAQAGDGYDFLLWVAFAILFVVGLVMVGSSSTAIADRQFGQPFHYLWRQMLYAGLALLLAYGVLHIPLRWWERMGGPLLLLALGLLVLVLIPGIGREVNGSTRWIPLGIANFQPSEMMKLVMVVYLAGYLVRRSEEVRSAVSGFIKPMVVLALSCLLLLMEPDFGAAAVLMATAMGMLFLGGVRIWQFSVLIALVIAALAALAIMSPYRIERITAFLDPWADPFASGFQLTQALIAFGRGEWFGVGLGSSIQKLFYLPEAHTDFLFAVIAEELGLVFSLFIIALFALIVVRAFVIGRRAERAGQVFAAYLAYGYGMWIGIQAFINIGVNMGILPTKGLTLPFMSYGGSSLIMSCLVIALLQRVAYETAQGGR